MKKSRKHSTDHDQASNAQNSDGSDANGKRRAIHKLAKGRHSLIDPADPLFGLLPEELVIEILAATGDASSVVNWSVTSRRHRRLADDPLLWRRLYEARFGPPLHTGFVQRGKGWQWLYRARACDGRATGTSVGGISTTMDGTPALYWGDLVDRVPHGYGFLAACGAPTQVTTDCYEGDFYKGQCDGYGIRTWPDGDRYEGDYAEGERHGRGVYSWPDGHRYEGGFADDKRHGHGVYTWLNGHRYKGTYISNKRDGHGVYTWPDGAQYKGAYDGDMRHGYGVLTRPDGRRYEGGYANNEKHGRGIRTWPDGKRYEGIYADGLLHGRGVYTWADGTRREVRYRNGKMRGRQCAPIPTVHAPEAIGTTAKMRTTWWWNTAIGVNPRDHVRRAPSPFLVAVPAPDTVIVGLSFFLFRAQKYFFLFFDDNKKCGLLSVLFMQSPVFGARAQIVAWSPVLFVPWKSNGGQFESRQAQTRLCSSPLVARATACRLACGGHPARVDRTQITD